MPGYPESVGRQAFTSVVMEPLHHLQIAILGSKRHCVRSAALGSMRMKPLNDVQMASLRRRVHGIRCTPFCVMNMQPMDDFEVPAACSKSQPMAYPIASTAAVDASQHVQVATADRIKDIHRERDVILVVLPKPLDDIQMALVNSVVERSIHTSEQAVVLLYEIESPTLTRFHNDIRRDVSGDPVLAKILCDRVVSVDNCVVQQVAWWIFHRNFLVQEAERFELATSHGTAIRIGSKSPSTFVLVTPSQHR